jgi:predicted hotdog family 3-hydroxylacyl-ACP dehydratase
MTPNRRSPDCGAGAAIAWRATWPHCSRRRSRSASPPRAARDRTAVADAMHALTASCAQLGGAEAAARCVVAERAAREASPDDALAVALEQAADACAAHVAWLGQALADDARQGRGDA